MSVEAALQRLLRHISLHLNPWQGLGQSLLASLWPSPAPLNSGLRVWAACRLRPRQLFNRIPEAIQEIIRLEGGNEYIESSQRRHSRRNGGMGSN